MAALWTTSALAQSAQPGAVLLLDPIVLEDGTLADELRDSIRQAPGGADVIGAEEIATVPAPTFSDAVAGAPGVIVQEFFGGNDQPRFQIRGSGTQQSPTERGLLMLWNGMPVNRADGSYIAGFGAPGQSEAIEIWRGAAANRLGASVLGGAVNFISPSASDIDGTRLSFGGGSDERYSASGATSLQMGAADLVLQFSHDQSDGFRVFNNESERTVLSANMDFSHDNGSSTKLFASYTDLSFGIPGPILKDQIGIDPSAVHPGPTMTPGGPINVGPNVQRDQPGRDATQFLVGTRHTRDLGDHRLDLGLSVARTDDSFMFPISAGNRVTDGTDTNVSLRYAYMPDHVAGLPLLEATLNFAFGQADRSYYHNMAGERGAHFGENDLESTTFSAHLGANIPLSDVLFLSPSISYTHATRDNDDMWSDPTRPTWGYSPMNPTMPMPAGTTAAVDNSYAQSYSGWSPKLALTWQPSDNQTAWVALSHSFEPPTHDDLLATNGGNPYFGPGWGGSDSFVTADLDAQTANTLEIGWRGTTGDLSWDLTAYHSEVRNEILALRDATSAPRASVNADRTTHTGVEAGLSFALSDTVTGRLAWTWQDFRFDDDPTRGNNRLGGVPEHVITAAMAWQATDALSLAGTVKWVPSSTPVDNMNTLWNDPYFVADLRAMYEINDRVAIVAEVSNLFGEKYASSTLVVDQARPDQAAFIPGTGRSFYIGTKFDF